MPATEALSRAASARLNSDSHIFSRLSGKIVLPRAMNSCVFRANVTADFAESVTGISRKRDRDFALNVTDTDKKDVWIEGIASTLFLKRASMPQELER
jgi:hypothetical protein